MRGSSLPNSGTPPHLLLCRVELTLILTEQTSGHEEANLGILSAA